MKRNFARRGFAPFTAIIIAVSLISPTSSSALSLPQPNAPRVDGAHVFTGGGYVPEFYRRTQLPEVVAHGNSIYLPMPITMIYPGPAVNPVEKRSVRSSSLRSALRSLYLAAKEPSKGWGYIGIADAPTTTVTVSVDGKTRTVSVYALNMTETGRDISTSQSTARKRLRTAIDRLSSLRGSSSVYIPSQIEGWMIGGLSLPKESPKLSPPPPEIFTPGDELEPDNELAWPISFFSTGCMLLDSESFPAEANQATTWLHEGSRYKVVFRAVLPGETGCD